MYDVARVNTTQPPDWAPTVEQKELAGRNEAYPLAGRAAMPAGSHRDAAGPQ